MFTFLLCVTINIVKQICLGTAHNVMERSEMEFYELSLGVFCDMIFVSLSCKISQVQCVF